MLMVYEAGPCAVKAMDPAGSEGGVFRIMNTLTAARAQMEVSLAFHMVFAALGIGLPLLMLLAEGMWLRTKKQHYRDLARKWSKAAALTFAIGAVSGTALSFEFGLLWPRFMAFAGDIIGPAFALEGYAFFIEAIFVGLYLYGWDRLSPRVHWLTGIPVALGGLLSGILVVAANAWMQTPTGFTLVNGKPANISPFAPFQSPAWIQMALHSSLSCYIATGFAVAGVYALGLLRGRRDAYHRSALTLALVVASVATFVMPLSGDLSARSVAQEQPAKLAAMEALFNTTKGAPLLIGGLPDPATGTVRFGVELPHFLSFLATHDFNATITGLNAFPVDQRPDVVLSHITFQIMVGSAFALIGLALWFWWARWRRWGKPNTWLLRALLIGSPLGFVALEAGWMVTEVGRQPWIIYHIMRTADGVTPATGVPLTFFGFSVLYATLGLALAYLLRRLATGAPQPASMPAEPTREQEGQQEKPQKQEKREVQHVA
jgi:cytochrome d ubiquinol oxidase subunit I